jgi:tight adherence protein B
MKVIPLVQLLAVPITVGIVSTWLWVRRRERSAIAKRLARWSATAQQDLPPVILLKHWQRTSREGLQRHWQDYPLLKQADSLLSESGLEGERRNIAWLVAALLLLPPTISLLLFDTVSSGIVIAVIGLLILAVFIKAKAESRRTKFCEQLPDALDLMVAILRSGHSVSHAVKAVADEIPYPCGQEFEVLLQRINLGQSLADALVYSSRRFRSYELDLMRRAVGIQAEVGGSLAELLDKTNATLRQRLKLARQLTVITAQSRLSAWIVGLLPILLAVVLNFMNPGYLQLLLQDKLGQGLLVLAICLELAGLAIMRRMSTMKI